MLKKVHKEPLEVGDSVRVKDGYEDPDNLDWNIAGWQGRLTEIIEVNPPMILVEWDSITLKNMGRLPDRKADVSLRGRDC